MDAVQQREVFVASGRCLGFGVRALAEQVERRRDALCVELADGREPLVHRFTWYEPPRKLLREAVVAHELEDARLVREIEERIAQHVSRAIGESAISA